MAGYTRQSVADIIAGEVINAAPINAEYNQLRDAFAFATGHTHDGSSVEGAYVPLIADVDALNKVVVDTTNNRISFYSQVGAGTVEQLRIQDGAIVPVTDEDIDLGAVGAEFKNLYIDGIGYIDTIHVHENAIITGTLGVTGHTTVTTLTASGTITGSVDINGGTIDGTQIGASAASTVTGTTITGANFVGPLAGAVTGDVTGNTAGVHTGAVTGDVTGNITAASGTSSFTNVTINGSLDLNAGTDATVTGLSAPVLGSDAATKTYVDQEVAAVLDAAPAALDTLNELAAALGDDANFSTTITNSIATKLPLAGGTMSGALAMGTNKVTGLGTPTAGTDATTKTYVDTADALKVSKAGDTMSGALAMGANKITGVADPTLAQDVVTKNYSDTLFGSTTAAATSAANASTSEGNAATSASNAATSASNAAADRVLTNADVVLTHADVVLAEADKVQTGLDRVATNADVVLTHADVVLAEADKVQTGLDRIATAADVVTTNTKASEASTSASNASTSASNAATSETNAAASYDQFDDRYLGTKSSDPTTDNDGDALVAGAIYFSSTATIMRVYTGSAWQDVAGIVTSVNDSNWSGTDLAIANGGTGASTAAGARANLGVPATAHTHVAADVTDFDTEVSNNSSVAANTAKVTNSTSASDLTSGTLADARFPATLPSISGANLTNLPITPAGTADFVASGTLPNGSPVVLKSDGTVEAVENADNIPAGSSVVFNAGQTSAQSVAFDPNDANKFVVAYYDISNSYYGTAVVGTISGTVITFGLEYVFSSSGTWYSSVTFDPNTAGQFIIAYKDGSNSSYGTTLIGTISGTVITFGAGYVFNAGETNHIVASFDPNVAGRFIVDYLPVGGSYVGTAVVGIISGTSITYGTPVAYTTSFGENSSLAFDPSTAGQFIIAYKSNSNSHYSTAVVGTISGTVITFGLEYVFSAITTYSTYISAAFDPSTAGKFVISYLAPLGSSKQGKAVVGTISGTVITFGLAYVFTTITSVRDTSVAFDLSGSGKFVVAYSSEYTPKYGHVVVGELSGTVLTFGLQYTYSSRDTFDPTVSFDPNIAGKFVVTYVDGGDSSKGTAVVGLLKTTPNNLTSTNFLGTSTAAYTNAQTATIMLQGGISTNQSGLTIGSTYYVQPNGTLSTTAASPSVIAGKALSTTDLFLANWSDVYTDPNLLVKTADLTVYAGDSIVVGAGGITITLPSSPSIGDSVIIKDGTGAVSTTPFTVAGNGSNIVSSASSLTFNSDWAEVRFVFINATIGWSV